MNYNWFTGTVYPCNSVYHPFTFDKKCKGLNTSGPYTNKDPEWLWLVHQKSLKSFNISKKAQLSDLEMENFIIFEDKQNKIEKEKIIAQNNVSIKIFREILKN